MRRCFLSKRIIIERDCKMDTVIAMLALIVIAALPYSSGISKEMATVSLSCPPGFVDNDSKCVCGDWPNGMIVRIIICDEELQQASIQIDFYVTYDEDGMTVGNSPLGFFRDEYYNSTTNYQET